MRAFCCVALFVSAWGCTEPSSVADTPTTAQTPDGQYIWWKEHVVDDQATNGGVQLRGGDGLKMADLDKDGHDDIISVHEDNHHIRLAFGTADPDKWELATLAEGNEAVAAEDISLADANGDGWLDIVAACELAHLIYFQNPGEAAEIRSGAWPRTIPRRTQNRGSWIRVFFGDLDGDGKPEVMGPNKGDQLPAEEEGPPTFAPKEISWFKLPENPLEGDLWEEHELFKIKIPMNARPVDLDQDGDLDILSGSRFEMRTFWFENKGGSPPEFDYHAIDPSGRNEKQADMFTGKRLTAMNVVIEDLNGDNRLDIIQQETPYIVSWMEQPQNVDDAWPLHKIGDLSPDTSTGLTLVDINGDGRKDLFTGGYSQNPRDHDGENITAQSQTGRLAWWEQPQSPDGEWTLHNISRRKRGMYDQFVARDMDADGDIDFVTTRGNSGTYDGVVWLEQVRSAQPARSFIPARASESAHLPMP